MKIRLILILLFVNFLVACATTPTGRSQLAFMPDDKMDAMGLQAFDNLKKEKAISQNNREIQFVQCIADAITQNIEGDWEVVVFADETLNAFALPGEKIGVHTGLINLVDNQDQLATVMGHEVAHVLSKHGNERMSQKMGVQMGMSLITAIAAPQTGPAGRRSSRAAAIGRLRRCGSEASRRPGSDSRFQAASPRPRCR